MVFQAFMVIFIKPGNNYLMKWIFLGFLAMILLSGAALAHTVTINLVMHIGNDINNTLHINETDYNVSPSTSLTFSSLDKRYISANNTTSIVAIAAAGTLLNIRFNNTYNSTHYLLQMTQDSDKNRFLIAMTNGTYNDIDDRLAMIDNLKTVSSTFGKFITVAPSSFTTFIRLEYTNVDIDRIVEWSGIGRLLIKNRGLTGRGVPNVTLEVVR